MRVKYFTQKNKKIKPILITAKNRRLAIFCSLSLLSA